MVEANEEKQNHFCQACEDYKNGDVSNNKQHTCIGITKECGCFCHGRFTKYPKHPECCQEGEKVKPMRIEKIFDKCCDKCKKDKGMMTICLKNGDCPCHHPKSEQELCQICKTKRANMHFLNGTKFCQECFIKTQKRNEMRSDFEKYLEDKCPELIVDQEVPDIIKEFRKKLNSGDFGWETFGISTRTPFVKDIKSMEQFISEELSKAREEAEREVRENIKDWALKHNYLEDVSEPTELFETSNPQKVVSLQALLTLLK